MERLSGQQGKGIFLHRHWWRCVLLAGLLAPLLVLVLFASPVFSTPAFAAFLTPTKNSFTVSPTSGPVSAVITVTGSGAFFSDGTQIKLGYTVDNHTCVLVSGGQSGVVSGGAFSGWFRWPANTGTGTFGVCASENSFVFQVGSYQVLSASAPRVVVAPTIPKAGQQATVTGSSFLPGGIRVNLLWRSVNGGQSTSLGSVLSNGAGTFTYTFTAPARASTGSYIVTGYVGSGSPATLSATTTFHVSGITIAAVPTSTTPASPTAPPTPVPTKSTTATSRGVVSQPTGTNGGDMAGKTNLFLPIALGGALLIALALGAGVLVVRRQRNLVTSGPTSGPLLWPDAANSMPGGANMGGGAFTPWPGAMYPGGNQPLGNPGMEYAAPPGPPPPPQPVRNQTAPIPFDPGLAEAMREAQVSLFATPRPPVGAEAEAQ